MFIVYECYWLVERNAEADLLPIPFVSFPHSCVCAKPVFVVGRNEKICISYPLLARFHAFLLFFIFHINSLIYANA